MIINSLDKSQNSRTMPILLSRTVTPRLTPAPKSVGMKDFVFYHPMPNLKIAFGSAPSHGVQKAVDFEDSLKKRCDYDPDEFQREAMARVHNGDDCNVHSPTGSGKTAIAEYSIAKNLEEGKGSVYTAPLKSICWEKFVDFSKKWGEENVGLLTGDTQINPNARIMIMTNEVLLNQLLSEKRENLPAKMANVGSVIVDEFHSMNDPERGSVPELINMLVPSNVQKIFISATVGNSSKIGDWSGDLLVKQNKAQGIESFKTAAVVKASPEERYVPQVFYVLDEDSGKAVPLMEERYSLPKLIKSAEPNAQTPLFGVQKRVLSDISKYAGGDGSVEHGIVALSTVLQGNADAKVDVMEKALVDSFAMPQQEARRASLLLSDKSQRKINPELTKEKSAKEIQKAAKAVKEAKPKTVVSPLGLKEAFDAGNLSQEMTASLSILGNGNPKSGLYRILDMTKQQKNKDMSPDSFRKMLNTAKIKEKHVARITSALTTQVATAPMGGTPVLNLVSELVKTQRTPALVVQFSQADCEACRDEFVASGQSLLTDDEKKKVKEVIEKYKDNGIFLGANENPDDLLSGVAVHHSGKMPGYKALVEELAKSPDKLCKVAFTTDTVGAGINYPVRTVVMLQLSKYSGTDITGKPIRRTVVPNEFHQITGRAGRRGKDYVAEVYVKADKKHTVQDIFKLVTSSADDLVSNFRPTYDFVANTITKDKSAAHVADAVDDSFYPYSLNPQEVDAKTLIGNRKEEFNAAARVLTNIESDAFFGEEGSYSPSLKGSIVMKARGVDELLFAKMMTETPLHKLSPDQLAAVACALTEGDEQNAAISTNLDDATTDFVEGLSQMKEKITAIEAKEGFRRKPMLPNHYGAQFVQTWVQQKGGTPIESWTTLVKEDLKDAQHFGEGDLFKAVNRTTDVVEQIGEVANYIVNNPDSHHEAEGLKERMTIVAQTAKAALERLKLPPVSGDELARLRIKR